MTPDPTDRPPEEFMRRAIELSRHGMRRGDGGPFGAVVVRGGAVVGEGWNRVLSTNDPTAHAEVEAIRDASRTLGRFDLSGCELFTSAEPCPMCLAATYWARIARVFYANSHADTAAIGFDDSMILGELRKPAARLIPEARLLADEALAVFREYAADPTRVRY
jgi:tRNA(Arg) A34 adenosine deaminase TadA